MTTLDKIRATEKHLYLLLTRRRAELDVKIARLQLALAETGPVVVEPTSTANGPLNQSTGKGLDS